MTTDIKCLDCGYRGIVKLIQENHEQIVVGVCNHCQSLNIKISE